MFLLFSIFVSETLLVPASSFFFSLAAVCWLFIFCIVVRFDIFCIFSFFYFVIFSETLLVPVPSLFLSLCCVQTFCFFPLKATCQPALSLTELVFIYVCICIFLEKNLTTCFLISKTCIYILIRTFLENNLSTCSPICKNFYGWNKFKGKELNQDSTAVEKKSLKIV